MEGFDVYIFVYTRFCIILLSPPPPPPVIVVTVVLVPVL